MKSLYTAVVRLFWVAGTGHRTPWNHSRQRNRGRALRILLTWVGHVARVLIIHCKSRTGGWVDCCYVPDLADYSLELLFGLPVLFRRSSVVALVMPRAFTVPALRRQRSQFLCFSIGCQCVGREFLHAPLGPQDQSQADRVPPQTGPVSTVVPSQA